MNTLINFHPECLATHPFILGLWGFQRARVAMNIQTLFSVLVEDFYDDVIACYREWREYANCLGEPEFIGGGAEKIVYRYGGVVFKVGLQEYPEPVFSEVVLEPNMVIERGGVFLEESLFCIGQNSWVTSRVVTEIDKFLRYEGYYPCDVHEGNIRFHPNTLEPLLIDAGGIE